MLYVFVLMSLQLDLHRPHRNNKPLSRILNQDNYVTSIITIIFVTFTFCVINGVGIAHDPLNVSPRID